MFCKKTLQNFFFPGDQQARIIILKLLALVQLLNFMSFFNICWEGKQLVGACFVIVSANVSYFFISEYIKILSLYFSVNRFALSFTQHVHYFPFDIVIQFLSV